MRRIYLLGFALVLALPTAARAQSVGQHRHSAPKSTPTPAAAPEPSASPAAAAAETEGPSAGSARQDRAAGTGPAAVASLEPAEIAGFDAFPGPIRQLLTAALDLTRKNLTYTYGSDDPAAGGMDCSGTIYYLLRSQGFGDVPRQASEQYSWVRRKARVYPVLSKRQENEELDELRPGDLMFWTGTYHVDRDPPVTHTMMYLGRRKKDGHRLMFGASDGRPYDGQKRNGVSVFDFRMPAARDGDSADATTAAAPDHAPDFAGYGPIPGMADLNDAASRQTAAAHETPTTDHADAKDAQADPTPKAKASPTPRRSHHSSGR